MKITRRQIRRILQETQWGGFTGGAAPLDEPPLDSGIMNPEEQQKVFDILVSTGSDPKKLLASGEFPDVVTEEASTIKYNADPALKGDQTKLPDKLQKGIINKDDEEQEEKLKEVKITKRQLRRIIKEEKTNLLKEDRGQINIDTYESVWTTIGDLAHGMGWNLEDSETTMGVVGGLEKIIRELKDNLRGPTR